MSRNCWQKVLTRSTTAGRCCGTQGQREASCSTSSATCRSEQTMPSLPPTLRCACACARASGTLTACTCSILQCVLWVVGSYCDGECPDYYMARYSLPYAPSRRDVVTWAAGKARSLRLPDPGHGEEAPLCARANFALVIPEGHHGTVLPPRLRACSMLASELAEACLKESGWCVPMGPVRRLKRAVSKALKEEERSWNYDPIVISRAGRTIAVGGREADVGVDPEKAKVGHLFPIAVHFLAFSCRHDSVQHSHTPNSQGALSKFCVQASKIRRRNQEVSHDDGSRGSRKTTKEARR